MEMSNKGSKLALEGVRVMMGMSAWEVLVTCSW